MIKNVLKVFGPERIILGSDTPYGRNNLNLVISHVRRLGLSERETAMILGDNLRDILML
jgi:predicted TIM-barrel fold metal-dependent hydrolase